MMRTLTTVALLSAFLTGSTNAARINFNRDIRPILADRCFQCHGTTQKNRQAELRLDRPDGEDGALRTHEGSTAIKPGDLKASQLWYRITTDDEDERMPPADSDKRQLSLEEQQLFKQWILEGAEFDNFWSFVPPKRAPRPEVKDEAWRKGMIDSHVMVRLELRGLQPKGEAD
ncbi:MAG: chromosome segregation protein, partial [Planctomycetes bacterium]|nr:chromosome segregation protein [Planctomycetota bacterium]